MLKYCVEKWDQNKDILREALSKDSNLNNCDYKYLVQMVVKYILNEGLKACERPFNVEDVVVVDHGDYQGCQLFVVAMDKYQPSPYEYLIASQYYGSCSGCDTLLDIQDWCEGVPDEDQLNDYMILCKDIVCSFVHPFKGYSEDRWAECEVN